MSEFLAFVNAGVGGLLFLMGVWGLVAAPFEGWRSGEWGYAARGVAISALLVCAAFVIWRGAGLP